MFVVFLLFRPWILLDSLRTNHRFLHLISVVDWFSFQLIRGGPAIDLRILQIPYRAPTNTPPKMNEYPLKKGPGLKRKGLSSNHHFSRDVLVFRGVGRKCIFCPTDLPAGGWWIRKIFVCLSLVFSVDFRHLFFGMLSSIESHFGWVQVDVCCLCELSRKHILIACWICITFGMFS